MEIWSMLEAAGGLLMGAIFVVIIGFVIFQVWQIQKVSDIDDATTSAFDDIVYAIELLEAKGEGTEKLLIDIRHPFSIVGLSADKEVIDDVRLSHRYYVANFESLKNPCKKTCLCICDFDRSKQLLEDDACLIHKCKEFETVEAFDGWGTSGGEGKYFFLKGRLNLELDPIYKMVIKKENNIIHFERVFESK